MLNVVVIIIHDEYWNKFQKCLDGEAIAPTLKNPLLAFFHTEDGDRDNSYPINDLPSITQSTLLLIPDETRQKQSYLKSILSKVPPEANFYILYHERTYPEWNVAIKELLPTSHSYSKKHHNQTPYIDILLELPTRKKKIQDLIDSIAWQQPYLEDLMQQRRKLADALHAKTAKISEKISNELIANCKLTKEETERLNNLITEIEKGKLTTKQMHEKNDAYLKSIS